MPNWLDLIIMILATWRLASLVSAEDGPFDIFRRLRKATGIEHYGDGTIAKIPERTMAKLIGCLWCMSLWTAGLVYVVWYFEPIAVWIPAVSAGAIIVDRLRGN